jgi:hypothetical protein
MRVLAGAGFVAFLVMSLAGCDKAPPQTSVSQESPAATAQVPAAPAAPTLSPQVEPPAAFWSRFRTAVLSDDRAALQSMVRFPFKTRGVSDDDPVVSHDQAAFWDIYARVLAQDTGYGQGQTERQHIESNAQLPSEALGDGKTEPVKDDATQFRVGALEFEKSGDKWYWVSAYLEE